MRPQQPFGRRPDEPSFDGRVTRDDLMAIIQPFRRLGWKKTIVGFLGLWWCADTFWHAAHDNKLQASQSAPPQILSSAEAPPAPTCDVTLKKYQALAVGISLGQANSIMGCKANETQRVAYGGTQRIEVSWSGGFLSILDATFDNDRLVAKSQLGLE